MKILLAVLMDWLAATSGLPAVHEPPAVRFVSHQEMVAARGTVSSSNARNLVAVYDDRTRTILLPAGWSGETPAEISVLVHELAHHMQNLAERRYPCPAAREELAYAAQEEWLGLFGLDLSTSFGIDRLTLKVRTACW